MTSTDFAEPARGAGSALLRNEGLSDLGELEVSCLKCSRFQSWRGFDQYLPKLDPQGEYSVIGSEMPAERAMTLVRVTIESDMFNEEMLKCL